MKIVVALGGNALNRNGEKGSAEEQYANIRMACAQLAQIAANHQLAVTHGNGPQIGAIQLQNEAGASLTPPMPLDICGAMSQGQIGYMLLQELEAAAARHGLSREVVAVFTRVEVDRDDPSFGNPTKPIGSFHSREEAAKMMKEKNETWVEDSGRGWRKVVFSPAPVRIVEEKAIRELSDGRRILICTGGGGIPVITAAKGVYRGIEGVVDKDLAAVLLAKITEADTLMILTDVPLVYLNYGTPEQQALTTVTVDELSEYNREGHFAAGSMKPKVEAAIRFASLKGRRAVITSIENAVQALEGTAGTSISNC